MKNSFLTFIYSKIVRASMTLGVVLNTKDLKPYTVYQTVVYILYSEENRHKNPYKQ